MSASTLPLVPATRSVSWSSFAACAGATLVAAAGLRMADAGSTHIVAMVAAGVLAAAAALALDDPARALLAAVPTSARRRLVLRLASLVPVGALTWWVLDLVLAGGGVGIGPVAALAATAVATSAVVGRYRPDVAADAGAALVLTWAIGPAIVDLGWWQWIGTAWITDTPAVLAAASVVAVHGLGKVGR